MWHLFVALAFLWCGEVSDTLASRFHFEHSQSLILVTMPSDTNLSQSPQATTCVNDWPTYKVAD